MTDGFLCGWRVLSEPHLPELAPWAGHDRPPDIIIRFGRVPDRLDDLVENGPFLQIDRHGTCLLSIENVAAYLVKSSSNEVIVSPRPGAEEVEIRAFLLGSVLGFLCHQRALFPLHASCVAVDGKAVLFCGPTGAGKSTAAIQLIMRGYRLVADDVSVIDVHATGGPLVLPAFPRLKLSRHTLSALNIPCDELERDQLGQQNKYHYIPAEAFRAAPIPLGRIFLLRTAGPDMPDECIQLARPLQKIAALSEEVFRPQAGAALGRTHSLLTAQALIAGSTPIWRLTRRLDTSDMDRWLGLSEALLATDNSKEF
jgi:HPr Serine kinase C-terminal domain